MTRILYTSDLHGNESQYRAFVAHAIETRPEVIIIGGELALKSYGRLNRKYIEMQRRFLRDKLPILLRPLRDKLPLETAIVVIPGNDDCSCNDDVFLDNWLNYENIDGRRIAIPGGFEIIGYSFVPVTPFGIKDREKVDLSVVPERWERSYDRLRRENCSYKGLKSSLEDRTSRGCFSEFRINPNSSDTIQEDLKSKLFRENPLKAIYVFHSPPYGILDMIEDRSHVGSMAIMEFIEGAQPRLTLHGHIHETVDMNDQYKWQTGRTWSMSAGNHNEDSRVAVLEIDTDDPESAKRMKLPCTLGTRVFDWVKSRVRRKNYKILF